MKKILYVVSVFPSTSATFVLNEMLMLKKSGFEIEIASLRKPKKEVLHSGAALFCKKVIYVPHVKQDVKDVFKLIGINLKYFLFHPLKYMIGLTNVLRVEPVKSIYDFIRAVYISDKIKKLNVNHIHAQFAHNPTAVAYFINLLTNKQYSFTCHAVDIFVNKNFKFFEEKLKRAKFAVTISNYNIEYIKNRLKEKTLINKLNLVRCGIDYNEFKPLKNKPENTIPQILSVGRLVEKKGFQYLIEALNVLANRGLSFKCDIIGDGPLFGKINKQIKQYNLQGKVNLSGAVDSEKVKEYLSKADLFVLPCIKTSNGDMDGIPVALMEAMAFEVPVISTNISGIPELIINGYNGVIVEEKNHVELADAIQSLLLNKDLREKYGKNGRIHIINEFDLYANVNRLISLFNNDIVV